MTGDSSFEFRLVEALQPIRGFALAQGIYHFFGCGLYDQIAERDVGVGELAKSLAMIPERLEGFLHFLAAEDLVAIRHGVVSSTSRARGLREFRPWYELLIGGYAQTFGEITDVLRGGGYASRDGAQVGIGSCGISQYDALPLVRRLLADLPAAPSRIVDLGCGDGRFLIDLLRDFPGVPAVGVDLFAPANSGDEPLCFSRASALDYVCSPAIRQDGDIAGGDGPQLFVAAFLLQEILEQHGRQSVVEMVGETLANGAYLAVVEVDHRPADPSIMRHGLGLAYYNPYYLLHVLTEQRLETRGFWAELFEEADAAVVSQRTVDPAVDSTGLEFGYLLTAA